MRRFNFLFILIALPLFSCKSTNHQQTSSNKDVGPPPSGESPANQELKYACHGVYNCGNRNATSWVDSNDRLFTKSQRKQCVQHLKSQLLTACNGKKGTLHEGTKTLKFGVYFPLDMAKEMVTDAVLNGSIEQKKLRVPPHAFYATTSSVTRFCRSKFGKEEAKLVMNFEYFNSSHSPYLPVLKLSANGFRSFYCDSAISNISTSIMNE